MGMWQPLPPGEYEFPLRALARVQETVVEQAKHGKPVA